MENQAIYNFFDTLRDDSLSFLYHGFFSDEFTDKIISLSESNIEKLHEVKNTRNKISFLIAESFQNIIRHGESFENPRYSFSRPGIFIFRIVDNCYVISSANLIRTENIKLVESKLTKINSLNEAEIKLLYSEVMGNEKISDKGGAGLGLIEMARKTGNKIDFEFEKVNEDFSFFYLQLFLKSKAEPEVKPKNFPITVTKDFHEIMGQNNTYLTYKGDFSQENIVTLLKIIERNLQINPFEHQSLKSLLFLVLTEIFQNISKHCVIKSNRKEGIFLLGKYFNKYVLSSGNFIFNNKIEDLEEKIKTLNNLTKEELNAFYFQKLRSGEVDMEGNAGIGFVEIAKECGKINYIVSKVDDDISFLNININI